MPTFTRRGAVQLAWASVACASLSAAGDVAAQAPTPPPGSAASAAGTSARDIDMDLRKAGAAVDRSFDFAVGADFPGTLARADSQAQLKTAVDELGFRHVRFHAVFHDALKTVVREPDSRLRYDFGRIDALYDALLAKGIRPFVELGFTPEAMATSAQTIFHWKGNTSHPEPSAWAALVDAFARHLLERYGADEVRRWPFEVWNEPNLDGFWEKADQAAYFALYANTARTLKAVDPQLRVGGPSTAGAAWVVPFLAFCKAEGVAVDFVTTHTYGVEGGFLDEFGHDDNKLSRSPDAIVGDVRRVRGEIDASPFPGLPLYITEWSTSYNPRDPIHDAYLSAPYILEKLRQTQGLAQAMSYWTYSDLFEEAGPPPAPFHGGFGLLTREGIRKPAFFAYKYLHQLQGQQLPLNDTGALAATANGGTTTIVWDWRLPDQDTSNRPWFSEPRPAQRLAPAILRWQGLRPGTYRLRTYRTGFEANDAHTAWLKMRKPAELSNEQLRQLHVLTADRPEVDLEIKVGRDGRWQEQLPLRTHDLVLITLEPTQLR
ncbi:xylan 1,4-beta-xylosidase [Roseateles sp. YR242]|uniref:GH39 family glycosyl hydrolase n=1 Tax=Roseateles sp. YR242 TaxID=1855305 RepID=UPI0008CBCC07|nr:beta-xylosidase [Roseateles sp. YR242]SEL82859.1 xylan 1,4-beta-xylosidase [Roseateles sp. YR242]